MLQNFSLNKAFIDAINENFAAISNNNNNLYINKTLNGKVKTLTDAQKDNLTITTAHLPLSHVRFGVRSKVNNFINYVANRMCFSLTQLNNREIYLRHVATRFLLELL